MTIEDRGPENRAISLSATEQLDSAFFIQTLTQKGMTTRKARIVVGELFDGLEEMAIGNRHPVV